MVSQRIVTPLVLVAAAVAGLTVGLAWQRSRTPAPATSPGPPPSPFAPGEPFPSVPLVAADGSILDSRDLVEGHGGIVIFLAAGCPPCADLTAGWQARLLAATAGEGTAEVASSLPDPRLPVFGIAPDSAERLRAYREQEGLDYPLYADSGRLFSGLHGVETVPLVVVVDGAGIVRRTERSSNPGEDLAALRELLLARPTS